MILYKEDEDVILPGNKLKKVGFQCQGEKNTGSKQIENKKKRLNENINQYWRKRKEQGKKN